MIKQLFLTTISISICTMVLGQGATKPRQHLVKENNIYLSFNKAKSNIEYFDYNKGLRNGNPIISNDVFAIKSNTTCNIYMDWLNPLQYVITFKDSIYDDPDIKILEDFLQLSYGRLNTVSTTATNSLTTSYEKLSKESIANNEKDLISGLEFIINKNPFQDKDLRILQIFFFKTKFKAEEKTSILNIYNELKDLDSLQTDHLSEMKLRFKKLAETDKISDLSTEITETNNKITEIKKNIDKIKNKVIRFSPVNLTLSDNFDNVHIISSIDDYVEKVKAKMQVDELGVKKIQEIVALLENSRINPDDNSKLEYFRVKQIQFDEDKHVKTSITITKYKIDSDNLEIIKDKEVVNKNIIFKKYDPVKISVSTGIFFANFTLKGYGVAQGSTELTVQEDNITSNTVIPATFLNFQFDLGSRTLLPLLQLGVDPSKKRPFILLGAGFAIPKSKFAITGGPIWTWEQSLDKLTVGGPVPSTSDLEKDIKYTFDMSPKGWYLGLQFSF